ncbi:MAG: PAS domain-containing protein [Candidatus Obscuribacter sp.]|nr:PAS domain-containing protein [Candidatus Obscuribacter sp.]
MSPSPIKSIILLVGLSIAFEVFFTSIILSILKDAEQLVAELSQSHALISENGHLLTAEYEAFETKFDAAKAPSESQIAIEKLRSVSETFREMANRAGYRLQLEKARYNLNELAAIMRDSEFNEIVNEGVAKLITRPDCAKRILRLLFGAFSLHQEIATLETARLEEKAYKLKHKQTLAFYMLGGGLLLSLTFSGLFIGIFNAKLLARLKQVRERIDSFEEGEKSSVEQTEASSRKAGNRPDEIQTLELFFCKTAIDILRSRERIVTLLNASNDAICFVDNHEKVVYANRAFERLTGYEREEILAADCRLFVPKYNALEKALYLAKPVRLQVPIRTKDQSLIDTVWSIAPESSSDGFIIIIHDDTEEALRRARLKNIAWRFQSLLDSLLVGIIVFDDGQNVKLLNARARHMLNIDDHGAPSRISNLLNPDLNRALSERLTSGSSGTFEYASNATDRDKPLYLQLQLSKYYEYDEIRNILTLSDISAQKEIERIKTYFLSMISHDLRTPLASISCSLELIKLANNTALSAEQTSVLAKTQDSLKGLSAVVDNFLELEKLHSGNCQLKSVPIALDRLIENIKSSLAAETGPINIEYAKPKQHLSLHSDEAKLKLVMINLISFFQMKGGNQSALYLYLEPQDGILAITISSDKAIPIETISAEESPLFMRRNEQYPVDYLFQDLGLSVSARLLDLMGGAMVLSLKDNCCHAIRANLPLNKICA